MIIQFSVQIDGVNAKKDKTLSLKLGTQELSPEETSKIFELHGKQIWIAMAETEINTNDLVLPEFIPEFKGEKSYSQRFREILYVLWEQKSGKKIGFEPFYRDYMEKLITNIKDKLD